MRSTTLIAALVLLAGSASAHTIFQQVHVNGVDQGHLVGIRAPDYDGLNNTKTHIRPAHYGCNFERHNLQRRSKLVHISDLVISAPAGAQITTEWHHTLTSAGTSDGDEPIAASHKGPVMAYLAAVPDATQSDVTGLKWFKIFQDGLDSSGKWGVDRMIASKGKVTFNLPSCIPSGQYHLRREIIALHSASSYPGAQFYMECAQLHITGGGSASPETVSFPGAYKGSDPGVTINIYQNLSNYTIPGPNVFTC